jgi:hypothetical protein
LSWTQLGLFLEASLPTKFSPKRKRKPSKSKPIKKVKIERYVALKPGELDDPLDDIFPPETDS